MKNWKMPPLWLGLIFVVSLSGCARAYYAYPGGCVPYSYCLDPPLPYTTYCDASAPRASSDLAPPNENATPSKRPAP